MKKNGMLLMCDALAKDILPTNDKSNSVKDFKRLQQI